MRICIFGHSGSGKSTSRGILTKYFTALGQTVEHIRLAEPLYQLQEAVYEAAFQQPQGQDRLLLAALATHIRRINHLAIAEQFLSRLRVSDADVVLNDDLRDPIVDYPALKSMAFKFIRIDCKTDVRAERLSSRKDASGTLHCASENGLDKINPDFSIQNNGTLEDLKLNLESILQKIH